MTTPNFDAFMPYSIQMATQDISVALAIKDTAQQNAPDGETHMLRQGTYVVQIAYGGPGACSLMAYLGGLWVELARVPAGDEHRPRTAIVNVTVLPGETMRVKLWGDKKAGYAGSITVTPMPNYKK